MDKIEATQNANQTPSCNKTEGSKFGHLFKGLSGKSKTEFKQGYGRKMDESELKSRLVEILNYLSTRGKGLKNAKNTGIDKNSLDSNKGSTNPSQELTQSIEILQKMMKMDDPGKFKEIFDKISQKPEIQNAIAKLGKFSLGKEKFRDFWATVGKGVSYLAAPFFMFSAAKNGVAKLRHQAMQASIHTPLFEIAKELVMAEASTKTETQSQESELQSAQSKFEEVKRNLDGIDKDLREKTSKKHVIDASIDNTQRSIFTKKRNIENWEVQLKKAEAEIVKSRNKNLIKCLNNLKAVKEAQSELSAIEKKLNTANHEYEKLKTSIQNPQIQENAETKSKLDDLKKRISGLEEEKTAREKNLTTAENKYNQLIKSYPKLKKSSRIEKYQENAKPYMDTYLNNKIQLRDAEENLRKLNEQSCNLESEIEKLQNTKNEAKKAVDEAERSLNEKLSEKITANTQKALERINLLFSIDPKSAEELLCSDKGKDLIPNQKTFDQFMQDVGNMLYPGDEQKTADTNSNDKIGENPLYTHFGKGTEKIPDNAKPLLESIYNNFTLGKISGQVGNKRKSLSIEKSPFAVFDDGPEMLHTLSKHTVFQFKQGESAKQNGIQNINIFEKAGSNIPEGFVYNENGQYVSKNKDVHMATSEISEMTVSDAQKFGLITTEKAQELLNAGHNKIDLLCIGFRPTRGMRDTLTDAKNIANGIPEALERADNFMGQMLNSIKNFNESNADKKDVLPYVPVCLGHSMGGMFAQALSVKHDCASVSFNPLGLGKGVMEAFTKDKNINPHNHTSITIEGDVVSDKKHSAISRAIGKVNIGQNYRIKIPKEKREDFKGMGKIHNDYRKAIENWKNAKKGKSSAGESEDSY